MNDKTISLLINEAHAPKTETHWLFAHGAGAPMDSDIMTIIAEGVAAAGVTVKRFEFPYMEERRQTGKKRPPNKASVLQQHFLQAIDEAGGLSRCVIGGKSMGGRMASLLAADYPDDIKAVLCLGYPFHPVGKLEKTRIDHFANMTVPHCIIQGDRDAMGGRAQVEGYSLPDILQVHWLDDGNHDLKPRVKSGFTHKEHLATAITLIVEFILSLEKGKCDA